MEKKTGTLVEQYAMSLLEVALEHEQLAPVKADVEAIVAIFEDNDLETVMSDFALSREDKASIIKLFQETSSTYVSNFLEIILHNEREDLLYAICQTFLVKEAQATNTHDILVTTAIEMSDEQKERLLALAKEKLTVAHGRLVERLDQSIIGGFIINANNKVIDTSIKSQLRQFKQNLK
ncbi:F0F1 ATP synthase subunit delta [Streptococcus sciuri]|uniref:ATP synthase subunit delta n=1 Tax=Streptococcus sciuri TaxID=2973939 RepID=A0ABT2F5T8_9STRE|nr:F0F1 ATP synthase subunit delta [Streptococcus sciuri]MCS4487777.1 F0F1 ATP synthase subunit delta [Streptococcus sciuri]